MKADFLQKRVSLWTLVVSVVVALLGSGGVVWQWTDYQLKIKTQQLDYAVKTADLRKEMGLLYRKIIELSEQSVREYNEYIKSPKPETSNHLLKLNSELSLVKDDFNALECKLASLEERQPRTINLQFIPPAAPANLTIR